MYTNKTHWSTCIVLSFIHLAPCAVLHSARVPFDNPVHCLIIHFRQSLTLFLLEQVVYLERKLPTSICQNHISTEHRDIIKSRMTFKLYPQSTNFGEHKSIFLQFNPEICNSTIIEQFSSASNSNDEKITRHKHCIFLFIHMDINFQLLTSCKQN